MFFDNSLRIVIQRCRWIENNWNKAYANIAGRLLTSFNCASEKGFGLALES